ncbi:MAG: TIGR02186 family protein [Bryobacteraceae bacterium]|jgi:uncharacterized protein (TIGR02186 family)
MIGLRIGLTIGIAAWLQPAPPPPRAEGLSVKLTPEVIRMGAFYSGEWMRISGTVARNSKVIVVIRGPNTEELFNRKARVGPIWINSGKVHISGVPSLFLCYSSEPVGSLLRRDEIERRQLDELAIKRQMIVAPKEMDQEIIRAHYVALKTEERVYRVVSDGLKMGAPGETGVPFSVDFHWPRKASPAHYEVRVYECRDGAVVGRVAAPLDVVKTGFPAAIADLAREHDSAYGVVAVLVAVLVGFGIDFLAAGLRRKLRGASAAASERRAPEEEPERLGKGMGKP